MGQSVPRFNFGELRSSRTILLLVPARITVYKIWILQLDQIYQAAGSAFGSSGYNRKNRGRKQDETAKPSPWFRLLPCLISWEKIPWHFLLAETGACITASTVWRQPSAYRENNLPKAKLPICPALFVFKQCLPGGVLLQSDPVRFRLASFTRPLRSCGRLPGSPQPEQPKRLMPSALFITKPSSYSQARLLLKKRLPCCRRANPMPISWPIIKVNLASTLNKLELFTEGPRRFIGAVAAEPLSPTKSSTTSAIRSAQGGIP